VGVRACDGVRAIVIDGVAVSVDVRVRDIEGDADGETVFVCVVLRVCV